MRVGSLLSTQPARVHPLMRAWSATPTLQTADVRATERVNARNSGFVREQRPTTDTLVPKTQTTSPITAHCQHFSPRWSALWARQHPRQHSPCNQTGRIARHEAPTRRGHAASQLLMAHPPTAADMEGAPSPTRPRCSTRWREKFVHRTQKHREIETNSTTARRQQGTSETGITSAPENCTTNAHFSPAKAIAVSIPHRRKQAKAMAVSDNRATSPTGPGCGARGGVRVCPQKSRMQFDRVKFQ